VFICVHLWFQFFFGGSTIQRGAHGPTTRQNRVAPPTDRSAEFIPLHLTKDHAGLACSFAFFHAHAEAE